MVDSEADDPGRRLSSLANWLKLLIHHLASQRVRSRVETEDLVQEVFLRALAHQGGLPPRSDGEQALRRWLVRIARNCVIDVLRCLRSSKRSCTEVPLVRADWSASGMHASQIGSPLPGPATAAADQELQDRLLAGFHALSAEHRRVIGLRQFEGLSAAETGQRMGRSEAAIHSLYRRALSAWAVLG